MSGPFANTGEAVLRNLVWAVERVNSRGGVATQEGKRRLVLNRYDSKGQSEEALTSLRSAIDSGAQFVLQGNSSANAAVLMDAIQKHNEREPQKRVLFLNYAAVDPALTQEKCNFWHFRFDAHADMRMVALMQVLKQDSKLKSVYLIGQDYSFGQSVLREAKLQLEKLRPDIQIAGDELHPMGRVKDFLQYAAKIKASGMKASFTPSMAMRWVHLPQWVMLVLARSWLLPSGCPMFPALRAPSSINLSSSVLQNLQKTICTCECNSWWRPWRNQSKRRVRLSHWRWPCNLKTLR
jgi:ABC-type branched-subunit amino acid transport system substrate-binding protein